MIVTKENLSEVIEKLLLKSRLALDTETTGLEIWREDRMFSLILADEKEEYYFSFLSSEMNPSLNKEETLPKLSVLFSGNRTLYMHNAKFDMGVLSQEGIEVTCSVHDTEVGARLERNDHLTYSLADCAARIGLSKSDEVEEYIKKNKLWEWRTIPGKKIRKKNKFFSKVPYEIMAKYAMQDARVTYALGKHQENFIREFDEREKARSPSTLLSLLETEKKVTKTTFGMERRGIRIDTKYCEESIAALDAITKKEIETFENLTGFEYKDSGKHLSLVFSAQGLIIPKTEKGNSSFSDGSLAFIKHPAVEHIRNIRDAQKRANTYFRSFLFHADKNGYIHTNLRQAGTATGRYSCSDPNLQNLTKDEDTRSISVRRAFIPDEDTLFAMIDYDQMEFRMLLDYAGELELIQKIIAGLDPHQATADLTGLVRRAAKTLNFALLYGVGIDKLSLMLDVERDIAQIYKHKYFQGLPRVRRFLHLVSTRAKQTGLLRSWDGRAFSYPDPEFAYKGANSVIQGGCAGVMKRALVEMDNYLEGRRSKLIMTVHDEALLSIHKKEIHLIPELARIMQEAYPHRYIPLTATPAYSFTSWGQPTEGLPEAC